MSFPEKKIKVRNKRARCIWEWGAFLSILSEKMVLLIGVVMVLRLEKGGWGCKILPPCVCLGVGEGGSSAGGEESCAVTLEILLLLLLLLSPEGVGLKM